MSSVAMNGSDSTLPKSLQDLVKQHAHILEEHLNLWKSIQDQISSGSEHHVVARKCTLNTQEMLHNLQQLSASFDGLCKEELLQGVKPTLSDPSHEELKSPLSSKHNNEEVLSLRQSKKRRVYGDHNGDHNTTTTAHTNDYNDPFSMDTKPAPVEHLLSQVDERSEHTRPSKRRKQFEPDPSRHSNSSGDVAQGIDQLSVEEKKNGATRDVSTNDTPAVAIPNQPSPEEDDPFLAKVRKRHEEKEARRKRKADKKRKRGSNDSIESQGINAQSKREKKGRHEMVNHDTTVPENGASSLNWIEGTHKRTSSANGGEGKRRKLG